MATGAKSRRICAAFNVFHPAQRLHSSPEASLGHPSGQYQIWYHHMSSEWTVETLSRVVDAELEALPAEMRARFVRISELMSAVGLPNVHEPHVKHLVGPLWEMRLSGAAGIARALYVTASVRRVVVVRVFVKKTQAVPRGEIALALRRAGGLTGWPR